MIRFVRAPAPRLCSPGGAWTALAGCVVVGAAYPTLLGAKLGFGLLGLVLQALGLLVAADGFRYTYREILGPAALVRDLRRDALRHFAPSLAPPDSVSGSARLVYGYEVHAEGRVPHPPDDATVDVKLAFLLDQVESLKDQAARDRTSARQRERELVTALRTETKGLVASFAGEVRSIKSAAFGDGGSGLRKSVVGVGLAATGVLMSIAALLWQ